MVAGAMEGIRVVDLATWAAAPAAAALLADWGADVIHVEHPIRGDTLRGYLGGGGGGQAMPSTVNYLWELDNRNKKSLTLDLSQPEGREVMHKLIATADVFSSNLRPYELEKYQLEYRQLEVINPKLIYANLTGYGPKGPQANQPAFDYAAFWSRSGMAHMLTQPGGDPPLPRAGLGDHTTSLAILAAISAALFVRERTGVGQAVDVSLLQTAVWALGWDVQSALVTGEDFPTHSRRDVSNPLVNYYRTKDNRWITIVINPPEAHWPRLCRAIGRDDLLHDPRYDSFAGLVAHSQELLQLLDAVFLTKTHQEWHALLDSNDVIWAPVQTPTEVAKDTQLLANECFTRFDHPEYGPIDLIASPIKFRKTPASIRARAPRCGEHTDEILLALGYDWDAIIALKEKGVVA